MGRTPLTTEMSDSEQQKKGSCAKKSLTSGGEKKKDNKDAKTSQNEDEEDVDVEEYDDEQALKRTQVVVDSWPFFMRKGVVPAPAGGAIAPFQVKRMGMPMPPGPPIKFSE